MVMFQQMQDLQREVSSLRAHHRGTLQPMLMPRSDPVPPQASYSTASPLQGLEAEQAAGARYQLALEQMEMKKAAIANMEQQQLETAEKEAAIAPQKDEQGRWEWTCDVKHE